MKCQTMKTIKMPATNTGFATGGVNAKPETVMGKFDGNTVVIGLTTRSRECERENRH